MFPLPTLDTLGRMFLHLSPLVSLLASLLVALVSTCLPLVLAYSEYTWLAGLSPLALSPAPCLDTLGQMTLHLSCTCLPSCYTCLHLPQTTLDTLGWSCLLLL